MQLLFSIVENIYTSVMWNSLFKTAIKKKKTYNVHDPSYFVKIINISHSARGM